MSTLLEKLHTLTKAELQELQGRAAVLLGNSVAADTGPGSVSDTDAELVHSRICEALRSFGDTGRQPGLPALRRARHYPVFVEGVPILLAYVDEAMRPKGRQERAKAVGLVVRVIARRIARDGRVPVCHRTICEDMSRCGEILSIAFPGYMQNGLLHVLLKRQEVMDPK